MLTPHPHPHPHPLTQFMADKLHQLEHEHTDKLQQLEHDHAAATQALETAHGAVVQRLQEGLKVAKTKYIALQWHSSGAMAKAERRKAELQVGVLCVLCVLCVSCTSHRHTLTSTPPCPALPCPALTGLARCIRGARLHGRHAEFDSPCGSRTRRRGRGRGRSERKRDAGYAESKALVER